MAAPSTLYTYITMTNGARAGSSHLLESDREIRIGRGLDCDIVLTDPLSSRVHAVVAYEDGWCLRDAHSRNGTFVNGHRCREKLLQDGDAIQIGTAEFEFHQSPAPPEDTSAQQMRKTQIVRCNKLTLDQVPDVVAEAFNDPQRAHDILSLYQLSLKLLKNEKPDDLVRLALELLLERTQASVVGFLWKSEDGDLIPKLVIPHRELFTSNATEKVRLSRSLTDMVIREGQAVWAAQSEGSATDSLASFADAICVPLVEDDQTLGVLHLYDENKHFQAGHYEMALSIGTMLTIALRRAHETSLLEVENERLVYKLAAFDELIGESEPMQELKSRINRISRATGCVLIRGESGAGKELVARAIHRSGPRSDRPMLTVNCAAIPRELMESQLFGHKRGSFTGADNDHVGWFQQADTGTLFLDEVGELTLEGQAKLLRILEGHPFTPVGSTEQIQVDVRVIAATNRDLREFVQQKLFREDLYYRLSVFELHIPPLRDRGEDISLLIDYFLEHFKQQQGRPELKFSPAARKRLTTYRWPGNVRQLRNVIDSAVVMAEGRLIEENDIGLRDAFGDEPTSLRIDEWERKLIKQALDRSRSNVPEAAKFLGISRATLYRKIDEYGIKK